jgi:biopolymer transport protein TolR
MRRPRRSLNQINVVPYIDVMLVLLVIFMITAPLINPGQVELPSVGTRLTAPVAPLEVTLRTDQTLWLRDQSTPAPAVRVTRDELVARLLARQARSPDPSGRHRCRPCGEVRGRAQCPRPSPAQRRPKGRPARPPDHGLTDTT